MAKSTRRKNMANNNKGNKSWYKKVGACVAVVAGIGSILGISIFGGKSIFGGDPPSPTPINFENNDIGNKNTIIIGDDNTINYGSSNIENKENPQPEYKVYLCPEYRKFSKGMEIDMIASLNFETDAVNITAHLASGEEDTVSLERKNEKEWQKKVEFTEVGIHEIVASAIAPNGEVINNSVEVEVTPGSIDMESINQLLSYEIFRTPFFIFDDCFLE